MAVEAGWYKCGICGRTLDVLEMVDQYGNPSGEPRFQHTSYDTAKGPLDHEPLPIPGEDLIGAPRCDFCSTELRPARRRSATDATLVGGESWVLTTAKVEAHAVRQTPDSPAALDDLAGNTPEPLATQQVDGVPVVGHMFDERWAACDTCHDLIIRDKWGLLVRRAVDAMAEREDWPPGDPRRLGMREPVFRLYQSLRTSMTGPPVRMYPEE